MGRPNRQSELRRYRQHVRDALADRLENFDPVMHPDFALTDDDAADVYAELNDELRAERPTLLLVTVTTRTPEDEESGYCLGLRFCYPDGVAQVERLLVKQVRERYPTYRGLKPREVRRALAFTVWEVPQPSTRGGWPRWLGPTGYYT